MLVSRVWTYQAEKRREKQEEIASRQKAGGDMGDAQPSPEEVQLPTALIEHCLFMYICLCIYGFVYGFWGLEATVDVSFLFQTEFVLGEDRLDGGVGGCLEGVLYHSITIQGPWRLVVVSTW